ncbi:glycoside hydrolase family 16 protein [Canariomyces notabilis]|uniref:Glycoside hydrolase family 16 protein n=1 Tax=Canariomyces notabilis TaxID=2074819 RepID=A0AAN6TGU7_9PEZI|nr:glycoside hydrolase family 16 protein [Canariomyces arenarius]
MMGLSMALTCLIALLSFTIPLAATAEAILTEDNNCGCFVTSGNESAYFSHHRFFDFRSLPEYARAPNVIQDLASTSGASMTSDFFSKSEWTDFWMLATWNNANRVRSDASYTMANSPNNIYIEANTEPSTSATTQTWLTLRTQRLADFQTAAEIESASAKFKYLSVRVHARTIGEPGAITAMFTYRGAETLAEVQEADLEIRTVDDRNLVHYTNQPAYTDEGEVVEHASRNVILPRGLTWSDWATHRLDWTPGKSTWFVDDEPVAQIVFQAPRDESNVIFNAWSDGGRWTGNMSVGDSAYLQIQWIELVFNSTEVASQSGDGVCQSVCSIDETPQLGRPVLLWARDGWKNAGTRLPRSLVSTGVAGLVAVLLAGAFW